jgi:hypothetical protein
MLKYYRIKKFRWNNTVWIYYDSEKWHLIHVVFWETAGYLIKELDCSHAVLATVKFWVIFLF